MNLSTLSHQELLRLLAQVGGELKRRGLSRSSNLPVGDLAERLIAHALGLTLLGNSTAGVDARVGDVAYQIKARRVAGKKWPPHFGVLRNLGKHEFHVLAGLVFGEDYSVLQAFTLPYEAVVRLAVFAKHQNGHILPVKAAAAAPEAQDITIAVQAAWASLPDLALLKAAR